jgi:hypothetical protein
MQNLALDKRLMYTSCAVLRMVTYSPTMRTGTLIASAEKSNFTLLFYKILC